MNNDSNGKSLWLVVSVLTRKLFFFPTVMFYIIANVTVGYWFERFYLKLDFDLDQPSEALFFSSIYLWCVFCLATLNATLDLGLSHGFFIWVGALSGLAIAFSYIGENK